MVQRIEKAGLQVDARMVDFIEGQALPGTGVTAGTFWSALAGLGGVMWGLYQEVITAHMGNQAMILIFIVVIIGGLGSVEGCFIGALLVGLMQNYVAFLEPKAALISNIGLMVAILMWRPMGMIPVVKAK